MTVRSGPLVGIKVVELAGIGPGPMCAMLLAEMGATVIRIDRVQAADLGTPRELKHDLLLRSRPAIALDLKDPNAIEAVLHLVASADALIDPFRPGVLERLGLGPDACLQRNPRLVFGRMTGWGQSGPMASRAGHDLNYIALTGVLDAIGRKGELPTPPMNLMGDYGGGALYLALGMVAALLEARGSGQGQVVDAAIVDGTLSLATQWMGMVASGTWSPERGSNYLDSGAPFYEVYPCADGKLISVAPIEQRFFNLLLKGLDLDPQALPDRGNPSNWPRLKEIIGERFRTQPRAHWMQRLGDTDACVAPVLTMKEALDDPHLNSRELFVTVDGVVQPAPAPRFSRTPQNAPTPPTRADNADLETLLQGWMSPADLAKFRAVGVLQPLAETESA